MITSILLALTIQAAPACDCPYADIPVVGHRGSGGSAESNPFAENTVPSVRNAYEEGAEWAEIDVHLTSDHHVIVHHDFQLNHTVNDLEGCVVEKSWSELQDADATKGSGAEPGSATVPSLDEVLAVTLEFDRKLLVELKVEQSGACAVDIPLFVSKTVDLIAAAGAAEHVMIISFSFEALEEVIRIAPEIPVGFLTAELEAEVLDQQADESIQAGFTSINPLYLGLVLGRENTILAELKDKDIQVIPWTVNDSAAMETMFQGRVDGVITDEVSTALSVRAEQCEGYVCEAPPELTETGGCTTVPPGAAPVLPLLVAFAWLFTRRRIVS